MGEGGGDEAGMAGWEGQVRRGERSVCTASPIRTGGAQGGAFVRRDGAIVPPSRSPVAGCFRFQPPEFAHPGGWLGKAGGMGAGAGAAGEGMGGGGSLSGT